MMTTSICDLVNSHTVQVSCLGICIKSIAPQNQVKTVHRKYLTTTLYHAQFFCILAPPLFQPIIQYDKRKTYSTYLPIIQHRQLIRTKLQYNNNFHEFDTYS